MNTYEKAVAENMKHMGSNLTEWRAVEISGVAETTDDKGQAVKMPQFVFPAGYQSAPSMFKNSNAACGISCELCGHDIKNVFWIQNDSKKWTLAVGSECITGFSGGKSGFEIADDKRQENNRKLAVAVLTAIKTLSELFTYTAHMGYGRTQTAWSNQEAYSQHRAMVKLMGKIEADSADGAISGWITRKGSEARAALDNFNAWQKLPTVIRAATSALERRRGEFQSVISYKRVSGRVAHEVEIDYAAKRVEALNKRIAEINSNQVLTPGA